MSTTPLVNDSFLARLNAIVGHDPVLEVWLKYQDNETYLLALAAVHRLTEQPDLPAEVEAEIKGWEPKKVEEALSVIREIAETLIRMIDRLPNPRWMDDDAWHYRIIPICEQRDLLAEMTDLFPDHEEEITALLENIDQRAEVRRVDHIFFGDNSSPHFSRWFCLNNPLEEEGEEEEFQWDDEDEGAETLPWWLAIWEE